MLPELQLHRTFLTAILLYHASLYPFRLRFHHPWIIGLAQWLPVLNQLSKLLNYLE